jgi:hypothetical protein
MGCVPRLEQTAPLSPKRQSEPDCRFRRQAVTTNAMRSPRNGAGSGTAKGAYANARSCKPFCEPRNRR